jgi:Flp pilus assembly protein TadG
MVSTVAATFARRIGNALRVFRAAEEGNVAVIFSLALIPIMGAMGAAVDYSRASATQSAVQAALDVALLAGAKDGSSGWKTIAANVFSSNLGSRVASPPTPSFGKDSGTVYTGSVSTTVATSVLGVMGINSVAVSARGKATAADADNSCILTLDQTGSSSHVSLSLNGAPVINLSGCSIRSNTSMDCNGHDGDLTKSYASGTVAGCGRPTSNAPTVPDTYKGLATNISTSCAGLRPGVTWTAGVIPTGAAVKTVNKTGYTEYHICGDLTVTGSGYLTGSAPASDSVIIIENGTLFVANSAVINTARTAIVFTGDNNWPAKIDFPNGNGKTGTLNLSPPTSVENPWQAVAVYLDPKLTKDVNNSWGPGAAFNADGLVYLGNSNVVTDGNTASANSKCTKFVMNSFVTNGSVRLDFAQVNCQSLGLKQWNGIFVHLIN